MAATSPPPSSSSEPDTTPEEYRQRALLFADLGRYDDAAEEIAAGLSTAPADAGLLAALSRIHLAADQPAAALVAADRAVAAAPDEINPMVVLAMALTDNSRYADAARVATEVLRRWPADPYALRTGAALLSEARNGQEALNAAWNAVRLAPTDAEAHLVLALVAARLRLFDLAQRAYGEALDLDAAIGDAQHDVGIVRLERRRWARALEDLAGEAALDRPAGPDSQAAEDRPRRGWDKRAGEPSRLDGDPEAPADRREPEAPAAWPDRDEEAPAGRRDRDPEASADEPDVSAGRPNRDREVPSALPRREPGASRANPPIEPSVPDVPPVSRPAGPVLDPSEDSASALRQAGRAGASGTLVAALLTAAMSAASPGASRVWAGMIGVLILVSVPIWLTRRLTEPLSAALARLRGRDRRRAIAAYAALTAPAFIVLYAVVGGLTPLIAAVAVAAAVVLMSARTMGRQPRS